MAEITLRRKGPGTWLWIVGVLALVMVAWLTVVIIGSRDAPTAAASAVTSLPPLPNPDAAPLPVPDADMPSPPVAAFLTFAGTAPIGSPMPGDQYATEGVRRLAAALTHIVEKETPAGHPLRSRLARFQEDVDRTRNARNSMTEASHARVVHSAADLVAAVQEELWPQATDLASDIAAMRAAGMAVEDGRALREQTDLEAFFDRAADALRTMSRLPSPASAEVS